MDPALLAKKLEFEQVKARAKALRLRLTCTICGAKAKLNCPCETTQYCTVACQKIDWRERGHREACKKIRNDRAAEAAQAEAPTPPPPPEEVFYGPAPRSHADEVRARIAAEHEAARVRREADPKREPESAVYGSRCPICYGDWDVNQERPIQPCCCRAICESCYDKTADDGSCPLCRTPRPSGTDWDSWSLAHLRRHVENQNPDAIRELGQIYSIGTLGLVKSTKKAAKLYKRAVELGNASAMCLLARLYNTGDGVKLDRNKSMQLLRMGADKGDAHAQLNLGNQLQQGSPADQREAAICFQKAAEQGAVQAFTALADCYAYGTGVEVDPDESLRWLERAAAKRDKEAIAALVEFRRRQRRREEEEAKEEENEWSTVDEDEDDRDEAEREKPLVERARLVHQESLTTEVQESDWRAQAQAAQAQARARAEAAREETERFLALNGRLYDDELDDVDDVPLGAARELPPAFVCTHGRTDRRRLPNSMEESDWRAQAEAAQAQARARAEAARAETERFLALNGRLYDDELDDVDDN